MGIIILKVIVVFFTGYIFGFGNVWGLLDYREIPLSAAMMAAEVLFFILLDLRKIKKMLSDLNQPPTGALPTPDNSEQKE